MGLSKIMKLEYRRELRRYVDLPINSQLKSMIYLGQRIANEDAIIRHHKLLEKVDPLPTLKAYLKYTIKRDYFSLSIRKRLAGNENQDLLITDLVAEYGWQDPDLLFFFERSSFFKKLKVNENFTLKVYHDAIPIMVPFEEGDEGKSQVDLYKIMKNRWFGDNEGDNIYTPDKRFLVFKINSFKIQKDSDKDDFQIRDYKCEYHKFVPMGTIRILRGKLAVRYALEQFEDEQEDKYKKEIKKAFDIFKIRNKEYKTTYYKGLLRKLVLEEKCNNTCQGCGSTLEKLKMRGKGLEADHIIEIEDGGATSYKNGQALCDDCNKGKHYFKKLKQRESI